MAEYREFQDDELISGTRYRVLRLIGVGGMGTVYEVEHVELGKRFVLKALLRELSRREDLVIRLRNEWRALGRLEHPNIVTVTDAGNSASGIPFFVMERLEGQTLAQRMRRGRRFPVSDAVQIAIGVLEGLAAAHQIGVVHRDVKPPNIFLLNDGRPKVLDFGVAKIADDPGVVTARGVAVGTPRYMSPEQARGEAVDGRADVYSTGLILFETIAGVSPFDDARDANELILAHLARQPPPLSTLAMGVPPALDALVASMLGKGRAERPDTALEAARRLREVLALLDEPKSSLPPVAELAALASAHQRGTTRPDGIATRGPATATSLSSTEPLSWLERPTLPRTVPRSQPIDPSTGANVAGSWSRVSADTLVGLPPTTAPDAATPLHATGSVNTEVLTVVPVPDPAVTRTQLPAATRPSETPPPVAPAELPSPAERASSTGKRLVWVGSAAACVVAFVALIVARPASSESAASSPRAGAVRMAVTPVEPSTPGALVATPQPDSIGIPASTDSVVTETPPAAPPAPSTSARQRKRQRATVSAEASAVPARGLVASSSSRASASASSKKKASQGALPGSGL